MIHTPIASPPALMLTTSRFEPVLGPSVQDALTKPLASEMTSVGVTEPALSQVPRQVGSISNATGTSATGVPLSSTVRNCTATVSLGERVPQLQLPLSLKVPD